MAFNSSAPVEIYKINSSRPVAITNAALVLDARLAKALPDTADLHVRPQSASARILLMLLHHYKSGDASPRLTYHLDVNQSETDQGTAASSRTRALAVDRKYAADSFATTFIPHMYNPSGSAANIKFRVGADSTTAAAGTLTVNTRTDLDTSSVQGNSTLLALSMDPSISGSTIKQIVTATTAGTASGTSSNGTFYDPSVSASITPTSASSYLWVVGHVCVSGTISSGGRFAWKFDRDGTDILIGDTAGSRVSTTGEYGWFNTNEMMNIPINFIVPASSTSATTIKIELMAGESSSADTFVNRSTTDTDSVVYPRSSSQINIIEILPA